MFQILSDPEVKNSIVDCRFESEDVEAIIQREVTFGNKKWIHHGFTLEEKREQIQILSCSFKSSSLVPIYWIANIYRTGLCPMKGYSFPSYRWLSWYCG